MKGWLVVNGFLQSNKFEELYSYLTAASKSAQIQLLIKTSTELFSALGDDFFEQEKPDFAIFWDKDYVLAKRLEQAGVPLFNSAEAMRLCDDKTLTAVALQGKVKMPKTMIAPKTFEGVGYTDRAFLSNAASILGFPMVVKEACGSFGKQVYLAKDMEELQSIVDEMGYKPFLLQEFIASSYGRDVRINVVGGEVFCAMLRENKQDFRSNISGGGTGVAYTPSQSQAELALAACKALGLDYAGVDVLFGENDEPILCEVNSNPHFKSTFDCTGKDMSVLIMQHIKQRCTKTGWLIYDQEGAKRNEWFINECLQAAKEQCLDLKLKIYEGVPFEKPYPDFALVRTIAPALNRDLEGAGTRVFNSCKVSRIANDKYLTFLAGLGLRLPVLPTECSSSLVSDFPCEYPIVVKSRGGHGGQEVFLIRSEEEYQAFFHAHNAEGYISQKLCSEVGKDLRVYVLGGEILAGVLRTSNSDFRSNYSLGGSVEQVPVPEEVQKMVKILHKEYAFDFVGIDFIRDGGKWVLNEIEDSVGCRMLYKTTDLDVVRLYIQYVARRLRNPCNIGYGES